MHWIFAASVPLDETDEDEDNNKDENDDEDDDEPGDCANSRVGSFAGCDHRVLVGESGFSFAFVSVVSRDADLAEGAIKRVNVG